MNFVADGDENKWLSGIGAGPIEGYTKKAGIGQALDYVTKEEKTEDKLVSGLQKEKRLAGPENAIARGKKKRKISSCGSERKKKLCQTRKSRKNGSGKLIFKNQTRTGGK